MIIIIGNSKGGEGKSTIATNLAAMFANRDKDILLIDADPQRSSYHWAQTRNYVIEYTNNDIRPVSAVCMQGPIRAEVELQSKKYENIIIDTQGRASVELISSSLIADMIIMPVTAGAFSAWALEDMDKVLESSMATGHILPVNVLVNKASTNINVNDRKEFVEYVEEMVGEGKLSTLNPNILQTSLGQRTIYRTAARYGLAVEEMPDTPKKERQAKEKAVSELINFYNEVFPGV